MAKMYWKSTCSTCRNARAFVQTLGVEIEERNYAKVKLTEAELGEMIDRAGVEAVLNVRHEIAKERGWKAAAPTKAQLIAAALEDNNLVRRPIVIAGKRAVVGFDEAELKALLVKK